MAITNKNPSVPFYKSIYESKSILKIMRTGLLSLILIITVSAVIFSGCVSIPGQTTDSGPESNFSAARNGDNILELFVPAIDIFVPVVREEQNFVSSGSYDVLQKSEVRVVRLVNNTDKIQILKETSLLAFGEGEIKDVYFLSAENFSMTAEGIEALKTNPDLLNLNYTVKHTNKVSTVNLEKNFSGLIVYTYIPKSNSGRILVNDGAEAVRIILPAGTNTGNRILGMASPAPDSVETANSGEKIMIWNAPVSAVAVKYYSEKAPFYILIAFSMLGGAIVAVWLRNRHQIKRLHKITKFTDPNEEEGFRKQKG